MRAEYQHLSYCCGIFEIGNFGKDTFKILLSTIKDVWQYECAFFVSTFNSEPGQKEAYEEMKKNFKLIWQSPVRRNPRSGNQIFMCVYTKK